MAIYAGVHGSSGLRAKHDACWYEPGMDPFSADVMSHAVKCVASSGPYLASGGADDTIHLYDVQHDKDLGFLMNPSEGAVPCLEFFTPKVRVVERGARL
eukprot:363169-Chlamydomonas_euryale.AAC.40